MSSSVSLCSAVSMQQHQQLLSAGRCPVVVLCPRSQLSHIQQLQAVRPSSQQATARVYVVLDSPIPPTSHLLSSCAGSSDSPPTTRLVLAGGTGGRVVQHRTAARQADGRSGEQCDTSSASAPFALSAEWAASMDASSSFCSSSAFSVSRLSTSSSSVSPPSSSAHPPPGCYYPNAGLSWRSVDRSIRQRCMGGLLQCDRQHVHRVLQFDHPYATCTVYNMCAATPVHQARVERPALVDIERLLREWGQYTKQRGEAQGRAPIDLHTWQFRPTHLYRPSAGRDRRVMRTSITQIMPDVIQQLIIRWCQERGYVQTLQGDARTAPLQSSIDDMMRRGTRYYVFYVNMKGRCFPTSGVPVLFALTRADTSVPANEPQLHDPTRPNTAMQVIPASQLAVLMYKLWRSPPPGSGSVNKRVTAFLQHSYRCVPGHVYTDWITYTLHLSRAGKEAVLETYSEIVDQRLEPVVMERVVVRDRVRQVVVRDRVEQQPSHRNIDGGEGQGSGGTAAAAAAAAASTTTAAAATTTTEAWSDHPHQRPARQYAVQYELTTPSLARSVCRLSPLFAHAVDVGSPALQFVSPTAPPYTAVRDSVCIPTASPVDREDVDELLADGNMGSNDSDWGWHEDQCEDVHADADDDDSEVVSDDEAVRSEQDLLSPADSMLSASSSEAEDEVDQVAERSGSRQGTDTTGSARRASPRMRLADITNRTPAASATATASPPRLFAPVSQSVECKRVAQQAVTASRGALSASHCPRLPLPAAAVAAVGAPISRASPSAVTMDVVDEVDDESVDGAGHPPTSAYELRAGRPRGAYNTDEQAERQRMSGGSTSPAMEPEKDNDEAASTVLVESSVEAVEAVEVETTTTSLDDDDGDAVHPPPQKRHRGASAAARIVHHLPMPVCVTAYMSGGSAVHLGLSSAPTTAVTANATATATVTTGGRTACHVSETGAAAGLITPVQQRRQAERCTPLTSRRAPPPLVRDEPEARMKAKRERVKDLTVQLRGERVSHWRTRAQYVGVVRHDGPIMTRASHPPDTPQCMHTKQYEENLRRGEQWKQMQGRGR